MSKELNEFEREFIRHCKQKCPLNCDMIKGDRKEILKEGCPIIIFEYTAAKDNNINIDLDERLTAIINSGLWKRARPAR